MATEGMRKLAIWMATTMGVGERRGNQEKEECGYEKMLLDNT